VIANREETASTALRFFELRLQSDGSESETPRARGAKPESGLVFRGFVMTHASKPSRRGRALKLSSPAAWFGVLGLGAAIVVWSIQADRDDARILQGGAASKELPSN